MLIKSISFVLLRPEMQSRRTVELPTRRNIWVWENEFAATMKTNLKNN